VHLTCDTSVKAWPHKDVTLCAIDQVVLWNLIKILFCVVMFHSPIAPLMITLLGEVLGLHVSLENHLSK